MSQLDATATSPNGQPMSDNLRDRIAAVLGANSHMSRELQDHLADAVIRELGEELPLRPLPAAQEQVHQGLQAPTKDC